MSFDLIIFDCDGVLVDSEPLINRLYVEMLAELGYTLDEQQYLHEFAGTSLSLRIQATAQRMNWSPTPDFADVFIERLADVLMRNLKPVNGVREMLTGLTTRFCVASNATRDEMRIRLSAAGLVGFFENAMFSAYEVPRPKPFPDLFLAAAKAFDVPPARCVVVEDSLTGVQAAISAGMKVFGHAALTNVALLQAAGATTFDNMAQLPELLRNSRPIK